MRYAIVESGGKQYKAVEGLTIEVDRLPDDAGVQVDMRTLMMVDGDEFIVGTPIANDIQVKATIVDHIRGNKVTRFKYSPKKRIRVRGGHRQQYTRLKVDFIGREGEKREVEKVIPAEASPAEAKADLKDAAPKAKKSAEKKISVKTSSAPSKAPSKTASKPAVKKTSKKSER
jgi:large subunit ribosomal protein L21